MKDININNSPNAHWAFGYIGHLDGLVRGLIFKRSTCKCILR